MYTRGGFFVFKAAWDDDTTATNIIMRCRGPGLSGSLTQEMEGTSHNWGNAHYDLHTHQIYLLGNKSCLTLMSSICSYNKLFYNHCCSKLCSVFCSNHCCSKLYSVLYYNHSCSKLCSVLCYNIAAASSVQVSVTTIAAASSIQFSVTAIAAASYIQFSVTTIAAASLV